MKLQVFEVYTETEAEGVLLEKYIGIDLGQDLNWQDFEEHAISEQTRSRIKRLKDLISIEDTLFLFRQLSNLDKPEEVKRLFVLQKLQNDWGGSFYGAIPEQITKEEIIPVPTDFETLVETALFLAQIHNCNYKAIAKTGFYPLKFKDKSFQIINVYDKPANMDLNLDVSGVQKLLEIIAKDSVAVEEALEVADHSAFTEMIKHRKNLGYIPKPWVTKESLANFILHVTSREPLDMIWKWLNPWNFFDLADIFFNLKSYQRLLDTIACIFGLICLLARVLMTLAKSF